MSDSNSPTGSMWAAIFLTMVAAVIVFLALKWVLSFVVNHWFLVIVILLVVFGGLYTQFISKKDQP